MQSLHWSTLRSAFFGVMLVFTGVAVNGPACAQALTGLTGASSQWGSGWMLLRPPVDFQKGERLKIQLGGTAEKVLVRLLPKGASPDSDVGIVGDAISVPKSRVIEVTITEARKEIEQISVHGGPNPWGTFPLSPGNGPATIVSIERVKP